MSAVAGLPVQILQQAQHRTETLTAVTAAFLGIAWFAISLRLWVRGLLIKSLGWDDWTMLATIIIYTAYCSSAFILNSYNPQLMLGLLPLNEYPGVFNYLIASIALYIATTVTFKISLGLFFLRIMVEKWQRRVIYATVGFSSLYGLAYFFAGIFQCGNPANFATNIALRKCGPRGALLPINITAGIINALSDWILALLPVFLLRKAQMPLPAKISAGCLMVLGSAGSISSIVRLVYVHDFLPGPNFFWTSVSLTTWSIIECGLCITAASLATLRPLFRCCMENVRTLTPALSGEGSFGGSRRAGTSASSGTAKWTGRSREQSNSFVPLQDWNKQPEPGRRHDSVMPSLGWGGQQDPGMSSMRPEVYAPDYRRVSDAVTNAHVRENEAAWREYRRQEAGRKARPLERERIATQTRPTYVDLQEPRAQRYPDHNEDKVDTRRVLASQYWSEAPKWI